MDLTAFSIEKFELFLLVLVRTAGIFTLTPIFGANQVPAYVRLAIAFALATVFLPVVSPGATVPSEVLPLGLMIAREACVGLVIGFLCSLVFTAIQMAGQLIDFHAGFALATMIDPVYGTNEAIASRFHGLLAGLLFFVTNAHHLLIRGLSDSFSIAPVGQMSFNPMLAGGITDLFAGFFTVALRIAVPIIGAVFLADVALAVTARVVPQMNVLIVGLPLKLGVGLASMMVSLPFVMGMGDGLFDDMYRQMGSLMRLLAR